MNSARYDGRRPEPPYPTADDQKLADADRMLNDAGARLYVLEGENERLRSIIERADSYVADLDRHGSIDHGAAFEIQQRLKLES